MDSIVNPGTAVLGDIVELNLHYLLFAQRALKQDFQAACDAFHLPTEVATNLANLAVPQIKKLATTHVLLLRFNWDEALILRSLTDKASRVLTAPVPAQHQAGMAECAQAA